MDRAWLIGVLTDLRRTATSDLTLAKWLGFKSSNHVPALLAGRTMPNVATCLRIAQASRIHPSDVLRAAGYEDVIALLESAYTRRDLTRHTGSADSPDATAAASREAALAALQDASLAITRATAALHGEPSSARTHAPAHPRVHRRAG